MLSTCVCETHLTTTCPRFIDRHAHLISGPHRRRFSPRAFPTNVLRGRVPSALQDKPFTQVQDAPWWRSRWRSRSGASAAEGGSASVPRQQGCAAAAASRSSGPAAARRPRGSRCAPGCRCARACACSRRWRHDERTDGHHGVGDGLRHRQRRGEPRSRLDHGPAPDRGRAQERGRFCCSSCCSSCWCRTRGRQSLPAGERVASEMSAAKLW